MLESLSSKSHSSRGHRIIFTLCLPNHQNQIWQVGHVPLFAFYGYKGNCSYLGSSLPVKLRIHDTFSSKTPHFLVPHLSGLPYFWMRFVSNNQRLPFPAIVATATGPVLIANWPFRPSETSGLKPQGPLSGSVQCPEGDFRVALGGQAKVWCRNGVLHFHTLLADLFSPPHLLVQAD